MTEPIASAPQCDAMLLPYLQASDETAASAALERLICESAQPIAREIIRSKLRIGQFSNRDVSDDEAADLAGEINLKLVAKFHDLKSDPLAKTVNNFRGYVAVVAYHACDEYLRKKYPRRYSLKNQLRYVLTHREGLAVWESDETGMLCGFAQWRDREQAVSQASVRRLMDKPQLLASSTNSRLSPPDLLAAIFSQANGPLKLDDLVSLVADLWQVKDIQSRDTATDSEVADGYAAAANSGEQLDARMDQHRHLVRLWAEICELPLRQRMALLMGLRDSSGRGVLTLFPLLQIASLHQIADSLAMPAEKLAAFWNQLPLEDAAIAASLGVTRQQVINLRKCARERLARRTKEFG